MCIKSASFCFVLINARFVNFFSTTSCTSMHFSITWFILLSPSLGCPCFCGLTVDMIHENRVMSPILATDGSSPFLRQFQSSGRKILLQRNSSSLFTVFVTIAVSVAFPIAQLRRLCFCTLLFGLPNRCLCTRSRNFGGVTISIRHVALWNAFQASHNTLQIHLVTLGRTGNCSCCLPSRCT